MRSRFAITVTVMALSSGACARSSVSVPPVTVAPTGAQHVGQFVWYDLFTDDPNAVIGFYSQLFGWEFENQDAAEAPYTIIRHNGVRLAGMINARKTDSEIRVSRWLSYLSVADVDAATATIRGAGGTVYAGPRDMAGRGRYSVVSDPQGAIFVILRSAGGDPPRPDPLADPFEPGEWMWTELWTHDLESAAAFYESLVGYERQTVEAEDGDPYVIMRNEGNLSSGMLQLPWSEVQPNWLPYIVVADLSATLARVEQLGGHVYVAPSGPDDRQVGIIADPSGAALSVQEWTNEMQREVEERLGDNR